MPDWVRHVEDHLHLGPAEAWAEREVIEEVAAQLEDLYLHAISEGLSPATAERRILAHVEDWERFASDVMSSKTLPSPVPDSTILDDSRFGTFGAIFQWLADLIQDMRFSLRVMRARLAFTAVAVLTLGLGIGSTSAIFSVVDGVLLRGLPFEESQDLVSVWQVFPPRQGESASALVSDRVQYTIQDYLDLASGTTQLGNVAVFAGWGSATLTGRGAPTRLSVGLSSDNLFEVLGVQPHLGRVFRPGESSVLSGQGARVTLLSHELWQRQFGADPGIVGKSIRLDEDTYRVLGVLPSGFRLQSIVVADVITGNVDIGLRDLWLPFGRSGDLSEEGHSFEIVARLAPGATPERAAEEALSLLPPNPAVTQRQVRVLKRQEAVTYGYAGPLTLLLASAGVLLLISCSNVATLRIGETATRARELATRMALGASRWRIARQIVAENVLLGLAGTVVGVVLATIGMRLLLTSAPPTPRLEEVEMSVRVFAFAAAAGVVTGMLFGLAPLWLVTRAPIQSVIAAQGRGATSSTSRFQGIAVALQVGLTTVLLVSGGLFIRSLVNLEAVNPGFVSSNLAVLRVTVPGEIDRATRYFEQGIDRLSDLPGVVSVAGSYGLPFPGGAPMNGIQIPRPGQPEAITARRRTVWPGYHETLGIPILSGRSFAPTDDAQSARVMMVSESMARKHWKNVPVGTTVLFWGQSWNVIGVTGDVRHTQLSSEGEPTFYIPFAQAPRNNLSLVVRMRTDPRDALPRLSEALLAVDPEVPVQGGTTMSELLVRSSEADRFRTVLVLVFGAIATVLGTVGLFGVTTRAVVQRTPEMGLRVALGATGAGLVSLVLRRTLVFGLNGLLAGLGVAWWISHYLQAFLFGVDPGDAATFLTVAAALMILCLVAAYVPARGILRLDPARALNGQ